MANTPMSLGHCVSVEIFGTSMPTVIGYTYLTARLYFSALKMPPAKAICTLQSTTPIFHCRYCRANCHTLNTALMDFFIYTMRSCIVEVKEGLIPINRQKGGRNHLSTIFQADLAARCDSITKRRFRHLRSNFYFRPVTRVCVCHFHSAKSSTHYPFMMSRRRNSPMCSRDASRAAGAASDYAYRERERR